MVVALLELPNFGNKSSVSIFLSDPSPIIGYACHSLPHWLTHSVRLVDLMAVNDANCLVMS